MSRDEPPTSAAEPPLRDAVIRPIETRAGLRDEHAALLRRALGEEEGAELLDDVERFVARACASGALLEDELERMECQGMINYWATYLYRQSRPVAETSLAPFDPAAAPELPDELFPYGGSGPADADAGHRFFGWQRLLRESRERLEKNRLLLLVGASGSGQTSFVDHGLLPALQQAAIPGSDTWHYFPVIEPGPDPLASLAQAVLGEQASDEAIAQEAAQLRASGERLARLLDRHVDRPCLLVIDSFAQVLTLSTAEDRTALAGNLYGALRESQHPCYLVVILTKEYVSRISWLGALEQPLRDGEVLFSFTTSELRQSIEQPANQVGLKFDQGLVDRLVLDVQGDPAALSLLRFSLERLWKHRRRNRITWEAYEKVGCGSLALEREAEHLYEALDVSLQPVLRDVLLQLIRLDFGREATATASTLSELEQLPHPRDQIHAVLAELEQAGLVRQLGAEPGQPPRYTVIHEALLCYWPRLVTWMEQARLDQRFRIRLRDQAEQWHAEGRPTSLLWQGLLLQEAAEYQDLSSVEASFLAESRRHERFKKLTKWSAIGTIIGLGLLALAIPLWVNAKAEAQKASQLMLNQAIHSLVDKDFSGARLWLNARRNVAPRRERQQDHQRHWIANAQLPGLQRMTWPSQFAGPENPTGNPHGNPWDFHSFEAGRTGDGSLATSAAILRRGVSNASDDHKLVLFFADAEEPSEKELDLSKTIPDAVPAAATISQEVLFIACDAPRARILWCEVDSADQYPYHQLKFPGETFRPDSPFAGSSALDVAGHSLLTIQSNSDSVQSLRAWHLNWKGTEPQVDGPAKFIWAAAAPEATGTRSRGREDDSVENVNFARFSDAGDFLVTLSQVASDTDLQPSPSVLNVWKKEKATGNWRAVAPPSWAIERARSNPAFFEAWGWMPREATETSPPGWGKVQVRARFSTFRPRPPKTAGPSGAADHLPELVTCADDGEVLSWIVERAAVADEDAQRSSEQAVSENFALRPDTGKRLQLGVRVFHASYWPQCDDVLLTSARDRTVRVWDLASGEQIAPPIHHESTVLGAWAGQHGRLLTHTSSIVRLWDWPRPQTQPLDGTIGSSRLVGRQLYAQYPTEPGMGNGETHSPPRFRDEFLIASGHPDDSSIVTFFHPARPAAVAFDARGPVAYATQSREKGQADSWNVFYHDAAQWSKVPELPGGKTITGINHLAWRSGPERCLAISGRLSDGRGERSKGFTEVVWVDRPNAPRILVEQDEAVAQVLYAAFGGDDLLVTGDSEDYARVYHLDAKQPNGTKHPILKHTSDVVFAQFAPGGDREGWTLVTVASDGEASLWTSEHVRAQQQESQPPAAEVDVPTQRLFHGAKVFSADFDATGTRLMTASQDRTAKIWSVETGKLLGVLLHRNPVRRAWFLAPRAETPQGVPDVLTISANTHMAIEPERRDQPRVFQNFLAHQWRFGSSSLTEAPRARTEQLELEAARALEQEQLVNLTAEELQTRWSNQ